MWECGACCLAIDLDSYNQINEVDEAWGDQGWLLLAARPVHAADGRASTKPSNILLV